MMQDEVNQAADEASSEADSLTSKQAEALVSEACGGSAAARDQLLTVLYPQLRGRAASMLRHEASLLTLRPTELLHEAALKLIRLDHLNWKDRAHFMAICCTVMRQVIVDKARQLRAAKRQHVKVTTEWLRENVAVEPVDVEQLEAALQRLAEFSPAHARLVELRYFGGLTMAEIAHVTGRSERTVKRQWQSARAWLLQSWSEMVDA